MVKIALDHLTHGSDVREIHREMRKDENTKNKAARAWRQTARRADRTGIDGATRACDSTYIPSKTLKTWLTESISIRI